MQTNREEKIINLINLSRALKKALHDAVVHAIIAHAQQVFLNAGAEVKVTLEPWSPLPGNNCCWKQIDTVVLQPINHLVPLHCTKLPPYICDDCWVESVATPRRRNHESAAIKQLVWLPA